MNFVSKQEESKLSETVDTMAMGTSLDKVALKRKLEEEAQGSESASDMSYMEGDE